MTDHSPLYRDEAMMRMRARLDESAAFIGLATSAWLDDPMCWAQLGYAVMKDKPIALLIQRGTAIPENLRRLAQHIEEFGSDEDMELAAQRLTEFVKGLPS
jgi:hypothetical protein